MKNLSKMQLPAEKSNSAIKVSKKDEGRIRLKNHKLSLTCVCVDSKGLHAFTASKDGTIVKWCLKSRKIVGNIISIAKKEYDSTDQSTSPSKQHCKQINCIAISSDDTFLASGGWDKHIRIWSPENLSLIHIFSKHRQEVTALAFRRGHHTLYSGSSDRSVNIWSLEDDDNRCYVESLYGHESPVTCIDVLGKERVLSSGGRDQSVRIWKIVEGAQTVFLSKHESVDVVRYIDDKTFVSGGEDGSITIWTTMKRAPVLSVKNAHKHTTRSVRENGNYIGLSNWISALATFSLKSPKQLVSGTKKRKLDQEDDDQDESDDANSDVGDENPEDEKQGMALIASGSCNSEILVWKLMKAGSKFNLKLHQTIECIGFVNDLRFTNDGSKLAAACGQEHKFGRWWRLKTSKNCMQLFDVNK